MLARNTRRRFDDALPRRSASVEWREPEIRPTFIDKFQVRRYRLRDGCNFLCKLSAQALYARGFTLAVMERLFFRGKSK